jgi:CBS domain-containing membrane protein
MTDDTDTTSNAERETVEQSVPITVREIMTERVIYLREEDTLDIIAKGMERYNLRHLPVVEDDVLLGIVSHRDLLSLAVSSLEQLTPEGEERQSQIGEHVFVSSIMTRDVVTIGPDTPIWEAARIIVENKFGCLPVVNDDGKLIGIVTEHDFLKTMAH